MVKIQYISDIHLEHYKNNKVFLKIKKIPECENICVLGDIGYPISKIYQDFMNYCSNNWQNVFWVMGNHEYYSNSKKTMLEIEEYVKQVLPKNVYFMNNNCFYLNKHTNNVILDKNSIDKENYIKIIGSTLWSNIDDNTAMQFNDYEQIYVENVKNDFGVKFYKKLTPNITRQLFQHSKNFILENIKENIECLILTHHGIHPLCQGYYTGSLLESGFITEIPEIFQSKNIIAAICGHTHSSINLNVNGIKLLSNCYGYKGERQDIVKFNPEAILII